MEANYEREYGNQQHLAGVMVGSRKNKMSG